MSMDGKQLQNDSIPAVKIKADLAGAGLGSASGVLAINANQGLVPSVELLSTTNQSKS